VAGQAERLSSTNRLPLASSRGRLGASDGDGCGGVAATLLTPRQASSGYTQ